MKKDHATMIIDFELPTENTPPSSIRRRVKDETIFNLPVSCQALNFQLGTFNC